METVEQVRENPSVLKVLSNGELCILFQARRLSLDERQKQLDLTERAFSPQKPVDTSRSVCRQDNAPLVMRFGDVDDLRGLTMRLQLSNTFYKFSGQWWFSVESVSLLYNKFEEALFNTSEVYVPASTSYHCLHVSSLQCYSTLLTPSTDHARRWAVTFTNFQVQDSNNRQEQEAEEQVPLKVEEALRPPVRELMRRFEKNKTSCSNQAPLKFKALLTPLVRQLISSFEQGEISCSNQTP